MCFKWKWLHVVNCLWKLVTVSFVLCRHNGGLENILEVPLQCLITKPSNAETSSCLNSSLVEEHSLQIPTQFALFQEEKSSKASILVTSHRSELLSGTCQGSSVHFSTDFSSWQNVNSGGFMSWGFMFNPALSRTKTVVALLYNTWHMNRISLSFCRNNLTRHDILSMCLL